MRDLNQVRDKLKVVLMPLGQENQNSVIQKLRDCKSLGQISVVFLFLTIIIIGDLWGPLLVCLLLSIVLSITAPGNTASLVFAAVFVIVWVGAAAVTLNAQLLGGTISFFQSVSILGYCVFPLTLSAIGCLIMSFIYKNVSQLTLHLGRQARIICFVWQLLFGTDYHQEHIDGHWLRLEYTR